MASVRRCEGRVLDPDLCLTPAALPLTYSPQRPGCTPESSPFLSNCWQIRSAQPGFSSLSSLSPGGQVSLWFLPFYTFLRSIRMQRLEQPTPKPCPLICVRTCPVGPLSPSEPDLSHLQDGPQLFAPLLLLWSPAHPSLTPGPLPLSLPLCVCARTHMRAP